MYFYRMHGTNSHSTGQVVGGSLTTSAKDWKIISHRTPKLIAIEMEVRRIPLGAAVGEKRFNRSFSELKAGIPEVDRCWLSCRRISAVLA